MTRRVAALVLVAGMAVFWTPPALAVLPGEVLADPDLEQRARKLSKELRCVVCRNQSIDDSNAALARDMRVILRERLVAGDSDTQAVDYLVRRFGPYILLNPPVMPLTYILWAGPVVFLILTAAGFSLLWRHPRRQMSEPEALTPEDRALAARWLDEGPRS